MPSTFVVGVGLEPLRHARRVFFIADWAWHTRRAAAAGIIACPWPVAMPLANPSAIVATPALHRYPIAGTGFLFQLKSGLTSAPRLPQAVQVKCGSMSDNRASSGQLSPLMVTECEHL